MNQGDSLILQLLAEDPDNTLWLADENVWHLLPLARRPALLTNRQDIAYRAGDGAACWFNDWDLAPAFGPQAFRRVVYQISKEKAVLHWLLYQLQRHLPAGGELYLVGQKNQGIKSIAGTAADLLGEAFTRKHGNDYLVRVLRAGADHSAAGQPAEQQDYPELRAIGELAGQRIFSKPGTFGWQKFDEGSLYLLEQLPALRPTAPQRVLDLGCGYGLLTVGARQHWPNPGIAWLATDNCAAALACAVRNCGPDTRVFAGDRGLDAQGRLQDLPVDLILCNPPFHQGFESSGELTSRFLAAVRQWLVPGGRALMVVNQFVGLEKRAAGQFKRVDSVASNGRFKLVLLTA